MAKLIEVEERDINYVFGKNKPYSLDVYQRDYRWADDKEYKVVTQLLLDIELRFDHNMKFNRRARSVELQAILPDVEENFKAYFLKTLLHCYKQCTDNQVVIEIYQIRNSLIINYLMEPCNKVLPQYHHAKSAG